MRIPWLSSAVVGATLAVATLVLAGGCTPSGSTPGLQGSLGQWRGPTSRATVEREPWTYTLRDGSAVSGEVLQSESFRVYTTIPDPVIRGRLVQVLEAALAEYRRIAPTAGTTGEPMESWVFEDRRQWADFTRRTLGAEAPIYLQINRGGYTIGGRFVSHFTAEIPTWSTTAHEGFHQFADVHFKGRLPPFLEEGLSATFEQVRFVGSDPPGPLPRINTRVNPTRAQALRTAIDKRATFRLEQLYELHPGILLGRPGVQIEAFYAQSWAFGRFLQEYDNGKYKPAFDRLMADTVAGTLVDPSGTLRTRQAVYSRSAVKPLLEHYLGVPTSALQPEFEAWCRTIAYDEFRAQWANQNPR